MSIKVFISYRRSDSAAEARNVYNALVDALSAEEVFIDTSDIAVGDRWRTELETALQQAQYVVVVIGPNWLKAQDEAGYRRLDQPHDWVRKELEIALRTGKVVCPVLVGGAKMPGASILPDSIKTLPDTQKVDIRADYWEHDIGLLIQQFRPSLDHKTTQLSEWSRYPAVPQYKPYPINDQHLKMALESDLRAWKKVVSPLPEDPQKNREELFQRYRFESFAAAVEFMYQVAPGCDIAMHHPRWENLWKALDVYLTTWDIGFRISDRDIQLAVYLDEAYSKFPGAYRA